LKDGRRLDKSVTNYNAPVGKRRFRAKSTLRCPAQGQKDALPKNYGRQKGTPKLGRVKGVVAVDGAGPRRRGKEFTSRTADERKGALIMIKIEY